MFKPEDLRKLNEEDKRNAQRLEQLIDAEIAKHDDPDTSVKIADNILEGYTPKVIKDTLRRYSQLWIVSTGNGYINFTVPTADYGSGMD